MKNIIIVMLCQFLALYSIAQVNIEMNDYEVDAGETFTATIRVKPNALLVGAIELSVFYNRALLQINNVQLDNELTGFHNINAEGVLLFAGINTQGLQNDFQVLSIAFEAISSVTTTSNIQIVVEQITAPTGIALAFNQTNGTVILNQGNCVNYLFIGDSSKPSKVIEAGIYQAATSIESNGKISATSSETIFKTGEKATLLSGFEAENTGSFSIKIEDCTGQ